MAGPYPLASLAAVITPQGVVTPTYSDILESLKASSRIIFGDDAYLEADSQDGQLLAIFAQAVHDSNQSVVAAYNAFSPATAQGAGLSSVVRINHIARAVATNSQVNVTIGGVAGTVITSGQVADDAGNLWNLPATVTIPPAGTIVVTATSAVPGAIAAPVGSVERIATPTAGWQSVTNLTAASPGQAQESDAELRLRQAQSPAIRAQAVIEGIQAAILALPGVTYCTIYENDTDATDANGLPEHSLAVVVLGGDAAAIAAAIFQRKSPGVATYGTTSVDVIDIAGAVRTINFFVPIAVPVKVEVQINALTNYNSAIGDDMRTQIAAFINALSVGEDLIVNRLYSPALLGGGADSETYRITNLRAAKLADPLATTDIVINFVQRASCAVSNVTITVV